MKPMFHLHPVFFVLLGLAVQMFPGRAGGSELEDFQRDLNDGYEVATVLSPGDAKTGAPAVLFTARKKNLKGAGWPVIYKGLVLTPATVPDETVYTTENWVVSLPDKKKLGQIRSNVPGFIPSYSASQEQDGARSGGFTTLWGPNQEGWHYGLIHYGARWGCADLFLVNHDGTAAEITSIRSVLENAVRGAIVKEKIQGAAPADFVVGYTLLGSSGPENSVTVTDPLVMKLGFLAEVPKSDEVPTVEGSLTLKLARDAKGKASATVLGIKTSGGASASTPVAARPASTPKPAADPFSEFRKNWNKRAESGEWKTVRHDFKVKEKGRKHYVKGWVEGYVLQRLLHVDSMGDDNERITLYYWQEGQLKSVFELRKGAATQISEVYEATETYNFTDEKMTGWFSTGERSAWADRNDPMFEETGRRILTDSRLLGEPIYRAIGAD